MYSADWNTFSHTSLLLFVFLSSLREFRKKEVHKPHRGIGLQSMIETGPKGIRPGYALNVDGGHAS